MSRHGTVIFGVICCLLLLSGCFQSASEEDNQDESETTPPMVEPPKKEPVIVEPPEIIISPIDEMINQMTLAEKVGQLLVIGVDGTAFSNEMDNLIRNYHVGGIIVMGRNVSTTAEMLQLIQPLFRNVSCLNSGHKRIDRIDLIIITIHNEQQITTCYERLNRCFWNGVVICDGAHRQIIRNNDSIKLHIIAQ